VANSQFHVEEIRDVVHRMAIQALTQPILIQEVPNETDASAEHKQAVQSTLQHAAIVNSQSQPQSFAPSTFAPMISAACQTGVTTIGNDATWTATKTKMGTDATGCETCSASTSSCTCTSTYVTADVTAATTACNNDAGGLGYGSITAASKTVSQTLGNSLFICWPTACTAADLQSEVTAAAQAGLNAILSQGGTFVSVTFSVNGQTATGNASGAAQLVVYSGMMIVLIFAALFASMSW